MFTLNFIRNYDDGTSVRESITCPHYQVYDNGNVFLVCTYKDHLSVAGTGCERCIGEKLKGVDKPIDVGFDVLYVTNESGKTIDTIRKRD